jgi:hypothetical protein
MVVSRGLRGTGCGGGGDGQLWTPKLLKARKNKMGAMFAKRKGLSEPRNGIR